MSCPICSAGQLMSIIVSDSDYMCIKFPVTAKSFNDDDSCCDIITTAIHSINSEDIRVLYCWSTSLQMVTIGNNTLRNHFVGVDDIHDGSHLRLKVMDDEKKYLTQIMLVMKTGNSNFALAFKSDDSDKLYYVKSTGDGQPLVIDSTIDPPYIFHTILPTAKKAAVAAAAAAAAA